MKKLLRVFAGLAAIFLPGLAFAHEAYVLPSDFFWQNMRGSISFYSLHALKNPDDLKLTLEITLAVLAVYALNFWFRRSRLGGSFHNNLEKLDHFGPLIVRLSIAASFFFSAYSWSFLGPELPIGSMPFAWTVRALLFAVSFMILFGILTEVAGLISLLLFSLGFAVFGLYLATYLNYLGEIIVLILFGTRFLSFDRLIFGPLKRFPEFRKYETAIVRIFYGLALSYAAVTVKFLHPELTLRVINDWHLTQFHWLFPSDPLLVALGGGLAELAIGLFLIFGFEVRLTVLISLFYITLSLLYFRELVWPHLMLYGISLSLLVKPEAFSLDSLFFNRRDVASETVQSRD
ncbi:hypothetical protein KGQ31_01990 [Patescibacteria group bacterium]|nr:hypothetical protein [Patescibacteria group bacterium]